MNLNQLKIFYYTVKHGSLSAAAEALNITQPAVTKGIQRLQEHYDIKFFNRFGKKLTLTDSGNVLFEIAEKIFEMETHAEESIRDFQQRKQGLIRIHASESFGAYYLPSIIIPFSKLNPHIRILENVLPTELVVEQTATLNNDIGFISYRVEHPKLVIKEVLEDRLVLIVSPGHPLAKKKRIGSKDLDGISFVMHETGSAPRKAIDEFIQKNNISVFVPLELSSNRALKKAVEEGIGVSLISRVVANEEVEMGTLKAIPMSDPLMKRKFFMVHHKDKYMSEPLQNLIDLVYKWTVEHTLDFSQSDR